MGLRDTDAPQVAVYPVPFTESITLDGPAPFDFTLATVLGQEVAAGQAVPGQLIGNLCQLSPGAYVLTIRVGNRTTHHKVWKQ